MKSWDCFPYNDTLKIKLIFAGVKTSGSMEKDRFYDKTFPCDSLPSHPISASEK
jgi:hypothetical protein